MANRRAAVRFPLIDWRALRPRGPGYFGRKVKSQVWMSPLPPGVILDHGVFAGLYRGGRPDLEQPIADLVAESSRCRPCCSVISLIYLTSEDSCVPVLHPRRLALSGLGFQTFGY